MVDFENGCRGIDDLVKEYDFVKHHPALREHINNKMYVYVNGLNGEAGMNRQKLIQDYIRRTRLIDSLTLYKSLVSVPQADGDNSE